MGLKLSISRQDNAMYHDFVDAYWKVEQIIFSNVDGVSYTSFELNAYPSRDASRMNLVPIEQSETIAIGGPPSIAYSPLLWHWEATFRTSDIFHDGIPMSESDQKDAIYSFVKRYTNLSFEDVLES